MDTNEKQCGKIFEEWLNTRSVALKPLLWKVCCDTCTIFKVT